MGGKMLCITGLRDVTTAGKMLCITGLRDVTTAGKVLVTKLQAVLLAGDSFTCNIIFSKITNLMKDGVCSSGHTNACIRHQMPEIGEIKNGNKNINFLKEIAENGMMVHKCNEELRTINTNIS
jgi:hypothetical protein